MITFRLPDPMVAIFLMKAEAPQEGNIIRPSLYAVPFQPYGRKILCHTLTGQVVETTEELPLIFRLALSGGFEGNPPSVS